MQTLEIGVCGMTCVACSARIERALKKIQGVASANVNLAAERARVEFDASRVNLPWPHCSKPAILR